MSRGGARGSEDIHGAGGEKGDDGEGDQGLQHHADFCPAGEDRGIRRGEGGAGVEGQEKVVHEMGGPGGVAAFLGQHLREKKRTFHAARGVVAAQRTAGI